MPAAEPPLTDDAAIGATFEGFGYDDNATENGNVSIPPDSSGAAGTDRVIAVVNRMIEARTKTGALLFRDSLQGFFTTLAPPTRGFDPKVIYDQFEGRFLVVALEREDGPFNPDPANLSRILVAVSKTSEPASPTNADWWYLAIDSKTTIGGLDHWADYPGFEVDEEAVYITNNMFQHITRGFGGVRLWIIDKGVAGGFYAGGGAVWDVYNPYAGGGGTAATTMPAQVYGAGGVGPGIGTFLVSHNGINNGLDEFVQVVRVDDPLGTVSFTQELVNVGDIDNVLAALPDAPQSGSATLIEVNDRRALDAVWRDDDLWLTASILPNSGPDAGETTAHWFRLDTSAVVSSASPDGLITLADQGDIGGEDIALNTYTFFPSVAVNGAGDAKFGFSASAPTIFAGAFATGRQTFDPAGAVQASETVHAGEDFYFRTFNAGRNRWGDYSGISLDPSDDAVFWIFNQFADVRGSIDIFGHDGRWGTAWASCSFSTLNSTPVANAGLDQTVLVGDTVTLDGSASSDADGDPLTYAWSFTSVPTGSTAILSDATAVMPTYVADLAGTYAVQLIVNDGLVGSTPDTVIIETQNSAPVASAGLDQTVSVGDTVTLDGSASSDADGDPLTYAWSFTSVPTGSTAILSDATAVMPTYVADLAGTYAVQLIVNDGLVGSTPDTVIIESFVAVNPNLRVTPSGAHKPKGRAGGPFKPGKKVYTITNNGTGSMSWRASKGEKWVRVRPKSGSLDAGQSASVRVELKKRPANKLKTRKKKYTDTVSFTNATNGIGNTQRKVKLQVKPRR